MSVRGADIERLRELAEKFRSKGSDIRSLISDLDSSTRNSEGYWVGPKADTFRAEWDEVKPTFDRFADSLDEAARSADTSAENVENAT